nr:GNAT family N-acetyltransferase [Bacillus pumilus]
MIGTDQIDWMNKRVSMGYWVGEGYEGKGMMRKGWEGVIGYLFEEWGVEGIEIRGGVDKEKRRGMGEGLWF